MSSVNPCCVGAFNLCINQGATYTRIITWETLPACNTGCGGSAPVGNTKTPVDLTGYTVELQIKPYAQGPVLYDASSNITLGGVAGTITLVIPASATELFTWWVGVYDLVLTDPTGIATRLLSGNVNVSMGVSS